MNLQRRARLTRVGDRVSSSSEDRLILIIGVSSARDQAYRMINQSNQFIMPSRRQVHLGVARRKRLKKERREIVRVLQPTEPDPRELHALKLRQCVEVHVVERERRKVKADRNRAWRRRLLVHAPHVVSGGGAPGKEDGRSSRVLAGGRAGGVGACLWMITCGFSAWKVCTHVTGTLTSSRHCATRTSPGQFHLYSASHFCRCGSTARIAARETAMPAPPLAKSGCRTPGTMPSRWGAAMNA